MIPFGEWLPDQPALNNPGCTTALNVIPGPMSFLQAKRFIRGELPGLPSNVSTFVRGGIALTSTQGVPVLFLGTSTDIFRIRDPLGILGNPTVTNVSRALDPYTDLRTKGTSFGWQFAVFNRDLFATNAFDDLQVLNEDISENPRFHLAPAGAPGPGGAPKHREIVTIGDFLVMARGIPDPIRPNGTPAQQQEDLDTWQRPYMVRWSDQGNATRWNIGSGLADRHIFQSRVERLVGGGQEAALVFTMDSIWKMSYEGLPYVFGFTELAKVGLDVRRSVVAYDRFVWFLGVSGFYELSDMSTLRPIGSEKVDRFIRSKNTGQMQGFYDASTDRVMWSFGAINPQDMSEGMLVYDRGSERWSVISEQQQFVITTTVSARALELFAATPDGRIRSFTGTQDHAIIETAEFSGGKHKIQVNRVRPYIEGDVGTVVTIQVGSRNSITDEVVWTDELPVDSDGNVKMRQEAFFHRVRFNIRGGFNHAIGFDIDPEPPREAGNR